MVIPEDKARPNCVWGLARIVEAFPGIDKHVRARMVKREDGTVVKPPVETI